MREGELARRWYRPERPRLEAARAAVGAMRDPRAAWEALLAGEVAPPSWRDDPRRLFWVTRTQAARGGEPVLRRRVSEVPGTAASHVRPWPMTVAGAIAFASDPDGVMEVERLAREVANRLAPWDSEYEAAPPSAVVWREIDRAALRGDNLMLAWEVHGVLHRLVWPQLSKEEQAARQAWPPALGWPLTYLLHAADNWQRLVALDARVPALRGEHPLRRPRAITLAGRRFADLRDPFEPAVEIFALGYGLAAVTADAIVLYAALPPPRDEKFADEIVR